MKTLVIGRHAKSDWSTGLRDFDRPLNSRGEKDAPRMGKLLAKYELSPDLIISSPANRAQTTARHVADALGYTEPLQLDQRIYDEGHGTVLSILQDIPQEVNTAMLFGHNPTMEMVLRFLLQSTADVTMPTCGMACFEVGVTNWAHISPQSISLKWFLIPRLIS